MTFQGPKLTACLTSLAALGLVACGGEDDGMAEETVLTPPGTTQALDPAATPTPPDPIPSAPPEMIAPGEPAAPLDPTNPTSPAPGSPPPVLPDSPPN